MSNIEKSMAGHQEHASNAHSQQQEQRRLTKPHLRFNNSYASSVGDACDRGGALFYQYDNFDMTRRNSSLGVTLLTEYGSTSHRENSGFGSSTQMQRDSNAGYGNDSLADSPQQAEMHRLQPGKVFMAGLSGEPTDETPYRPMVGGGAAAAYNALRFDFYMQQKQKAAKHKRRMSSLSMGSAKASTGGRFSTNKNNASSGRGGASFEEQYEMLKLHHLNLMNEIQETALMLNLYEQQQLQRQQQEEMRKARQREQQDPQAAKGEQASSQAIPEEIKAVGDQTDRKRAISHYNEVSNKRQK